ncbi:UNVERIFIED_CONTAM: hypothetical protein NCL1_23344 [Trichonephila clavipes]
MTSVGTGRYTVKPTRHYFRQRPVRICYRQIDINMPILVSRYCEHSMNFVTNISPLNLKILFDLKLKVLLFAQVSDAYVQTGLASVLYI